VKAQGALSADKNQRKGYDKEGPINARKKGEKTIRKKETPEGNKDNFMEGNQRKPATGRGKGYVGIGQCSFRQNFKNSLEAFRAWGVAARGGAVGGRKKAPGERRTSARRAKDQLSSRPSP